MKVKICGVTCAEDAALCEDLGADALGFVHFPGRSRSLSLESISEMGSSLGPITAKVLVCKPSDVASALSMLSESSADILQLYSLEPHELIKLRDRGAKVFRVVPPARAEAERFSRVCDALVFENGVPGSGATYDYAKIPIGLNVRAIIAGGLTPQNVHEAKALAPYGVDVSSGVESRPGRKDPAKVAAFIKRCRS